MTSRDVSEPLVVPPTLRGAYAAAHYEIVVRNTRALLRIGAPAPELVLDGASPWRRVAVITAANPFSALLSAEANAARQLRLEREVERAGRLQLSALGSDPAGAWEPEPSLAVFDPSDDDLDEWMLAFGQNAVVVAESGGMCELLFHPHERARLGAEGPAAERAATRLWTRMWNTLAPDLLEGALHEDVVFTSQQDGSAIEGRDAVIERLRSEVQSPQGADALRGRTSAKVGATSPEATTRPCALLFEGAAPLPSAVVLFTLRRGSVARLDVRLPARSLPA